MKSDKPKHSKSTYSEDVCLNAIILSDIPVIIVTHFSCL